MPRYWKAHPWMGRILPETRASVSINGQTISLKMSIGVSIYPDNGTTLEALLPHADTAMYRVKSSKLTSQKPRKNDPLIDQLSTG